MASSECGVFSEDGRLFGYCGLDGKLKIWDSVAGTLIQEYTPNLHLASPCTCLSWLRTSKSLLSGKPPPKKKKARLSGQGSVDVVGMGLASGNILLYSTAMGEVVCQLQGGHTGTVNHLAWSRGTNLFSCGDDGHVVEWTLHDSAISSKWKADNGRVTCVLVLPEGETLLSASQTIRWWDLKSKQLLRSFVGHTSYVVSLTLVAPPGCSNTDSMYFLSTSRDDRFISAWSLNQGKDCVATFATEDAARSVSVVFREGEQSSILAAVTNTGTLHMFRHQLNGKRLKPLKPECTVTVSVEDKKQKETVQSVPIIAADISNSQEILIVYGSPALLTFEKIPASHSDKVVRLVRHTCRRKSASKQSDVSKVIMPVVGDDVEFVTSAGPSNAPKRSRTALEVPLEERLNNLTVSKLDKTTGVPKPDSMTQLLVQGLNSKDKKMMQNVLFTSDERLIRNTVSRLPGQYVMSLVKELTTRMLGRTYMSQVAALWLKAVVVTQAGLLVSNPEVAEVLAPLQGMLEGRVQLLTPLLRLQGRLDMLLGQAAGGEEGPGTDQQQPSLLVYQESESDSSDTEDMLNGVGSASEESGSRWSDGDEDDEGSQMEMEEEVLSSN